MNQRFIPDVCSSQIKYEKFKLDSRVVATLWDWALGHRSDICTNCFHKLSHILLPFCLCLQHEKYTSQLQLGVKTQEPKTREKQEQLQSSEKSKDSLSSIKLQDRSERKAHSLTGKQLHLTCPRTVLSHSRIIDNRSMRGNHLTRVNLNILFTEEERGKRGLCWSDVSLAECHLIVGPQLVPWRPSLHWV